MEAVKQKTAELLKALTKEHFRTALINGKNGPVDTPPRNLKRNVNPKEFLSLIFTSKGLGSIPSEDLDGFKCIVPLQHGRTLNSHLTTKVLSRARRIIMLSEVACKVIWVGHPCSKSRSDSENNAREHSFVFMTFFELGILSL
ncbi:hypothetical protein TNCV_3465821 [Trichonephila clavipes]|nr:hypothetical protein TNCV_3465821 [Trichonephila clavipes]